MSGRVCEKHNEWCPTGECRWCEPPNRPAVVDPRVPWAPRPLQPGETKCACGTWIIPEERGEVQEVTRYVSHMRERCVDYLGRKVTKAAR